MMNQSISRESLWTQKRKGGEKVLKFLKHNIIPDSSIGWLPNAIMRGRYILNNNKIDIIFSSSPPQTNHLIASYLSSKYNIPWIADFRDPWTGQFWVNEGKLRLPIVNKIDKKLESIICNKCHSITTISYGMSAHLDLITQTEKTVIYNGYDSSEIPIKSTKKSKFTIAYTGSLSFKHQPIGLFNSLVHLRATNFDVFDNISVTFMGSWDSHLEKLVKKYDLVDKVEYLGFSDRKEALDLLINSNMSLLIGVKDSNYGVIPSKLFDYIGIGNPIIAYGLEKEASNIITTHQLGKVFSFEDNEVLSSEYILKTYRNKSKKIIDLNSDNLSIYKRVYQAEQLSKVFDKTLKQTQSN